MLRKLNSGKILLIASMISWIIISVATYYGHASPFYTRFDAFADFVKIVLQFPGGHIVHDALGFDFLVKRYQGVVAGWSTRGSPYELGHTFLLPMTTLISILCRGMLGWIGPVTLGVALAAICVTSLFIAVNEHSSDKFLPWFIVLSYPVFFGLDRGNLFALFAGTLTVIALLRREQEVLTMILLAIAINIRPNLAFFLPALFTWRGGIWCASLAILMFGVSLAISHALLPSYTLSELHLGLDAYAWQYAARGQGVAFGSSLYGALWLVRWTPPMFVFPALALAIAGIAWVAFQRDRLSYGCFCFICASCMFIATPILNDYHLLIFAVPLVVGASPYAFFASVLMMLPKGYGHAGDSTYQVIANPVIMLAALAPMLLRAFTSNDVARTPDLRLN